MHALLPSSKRQPLRGSGTCVFRPQPSGLSSCPPDHDRCEEATRSSAQESPWHTAGVEKAIRACDSQAKSQMCEGQQVGTRHNGR